MDSCFKTSRTPRGFSPSILPACRLRIGRSFKPPAQGTDSTEDTKKFIVRATVKAIPEGMTEVPFICTLHDEMTGKLKLHAK